MLVVWGELGGQKYSCIYICRRWFETDQGKFVCAGCRDEGRGLLKTPDN